MSNRHFIISMIINGEKVPAFSATTLSIPEPPSDNFDAIVASSREKYSRPRAEVEEEIRETIEASEKYKKELSDSGRAAGEQGNTNDYSGATFQFQSSRINESKSFKPAAAREKAAQTAQKTSYENNRLIAQDSPKLAPERPETSISNNPASRNTPPLNSYSEQRPNKNKKHKNRNRRPQTPQQAFRDQRISPNTAEDKSDRPTLKDLGKLLEEQQKGNHESEN